MNRPTKIMFLTALLSPSMMSGGMLRSASLSEEAAGAPKRIRFQVAVIEESAAGRKLISKATIEGPPGTDFGVDLQSRRFKMNARFLTDLISPGELKVRAKLNTRRLYGYSENNLPLYEEDNQSEILQLGFEEQVVLLPFGKGSSELLKVEVTPSITDQPLFMASGKPRPLEISISEPSPGGVIGIHALKIPHNFDVEAILLENGQEVARGASPCLIEEPQEILLRPGEFASSDVVNNPLVVKLTVDLFERSRPVDEATVSFDAHRIKGQNPDDRQPVALNWAGVIGIGSAMDYDLSAHYLQTSGKKYELRFRVKLAANESTD